MRTIAKTFLFLFVLISLSACSTTDNNKKVTDNNKKVINPCGSKQACLNDPNCQCWCSQLCGWRKKTSEDRPIYVENDPNGKFCYCKQWDYDHYKDNCVDGKNVKQPKGAK